MAFDAVTSIWVIFGEARHRKLCPLLCLWRKRGRSGIKMKSPEYWNQVLKNFALKSRNVNRQKNRAIWIRFYPAQFGGDFSSWKNHIVWTGTKGMSIVHRFLFHAHWLKSAADLVASRTCTIVAGGGCRAPLAGTSRFLLYRSLHHGAFPCSQSVSSKFFKRVTTEAKKIKNNLFR